MFFSRFILSGDYIIFSNMKISRLKLICVLQFALSGYMALSSFVNIFDAPGWHSTISFIAFCLAIYLASFVVQVIYKNYPDTPLSPAQKSAFNWLFMLNFFMFSALLTYNISDIKLMSGSSGDDASLQTPLFYSGVILHLLVTIFQVYILLGMIKLRRSLIANFEKRSEGVDVLAT